ncbi:MAG: hypothetical protein ACPGVU_21940, partial [Limisphaerales bacterium]
MAILAVLMLGFVMLVDVSKLTLPSGMSVGGSATYFEESIVESNTSRNKIAIIDVNGVITSSGAGGPN